MLGIIATNALELGVDIGVLDAVIMLGFPMGGLASFVGRSHLRVCRSAKQNHRDNKLVELDVVRAMLSVSS